MSLPLQTEVKRLRWTPVEPAREHARNDDCELTHKSHRSNCESHARENQPESSALASLSADYAGLCRLDPDPLRLS